jgi:hypothetical protein
VRLHSSHRNHFSMSVGLLPSPLMEIRFYWRGAVRFQHNAVSVSVKSCLSTDFPDQDFADKSSRTASAEVQEEMPLQSVPGCAFLWGIWRGCIVRSVCRCLPTKTDLMIGVAWNAARCSSGQCKLSVSSWSLCRNQDVKFLVNALPG